MKKFHITLKFAESGEEIGDFDVDLNDDYKSSEINYMLEQQYNITLEELTKKLKTQEQISLFFDDGTKVTCSKN